MAFSQIKLDGVNMIAPSEAVTNENRIVTYAALLGISIG
jgi:hypothetical protein